MGYTDIIIRHLTDDQPELLPRLDVPPGELHQLVADA